MSPRKRGWSDITVTDQFCGAGGSSIGAFEQGLRIRMAMNHWKLAVDGVKLCIACGHGLPLSAFYRRSDSPDGLRSDCKECVKARAKRSVAGRVADVAEYQRRYRLTHREALNRACTERQKRYDRAGYHRQYRAKNLSTVHANEQRYRDSHKENETVRRHSRRAVPMADVAREYLRIILRDPCSYCGAPRGTVDHIDPIALGGDNSWSNLASACLSCNSSKGTQSLILFLLGNKRDRVKQYRNAVTPPAMATLIERQVAAMTGDRAA